jgi:prepilin-type N-terminal cleavage/methylation domain-containing protein/prepilin-type processing-associated H-X9-DG protein
MYSGNKRHGFTLIELLVAIAVIAILAAILFPVFAHAREKARQLTCLSNLKQIGTAILMYANDYDERYPGGPEFGPFLWVPGPGGSWEGMTGKQGNQIVPIAPKSVPLRLMPYLKSISVFLCPSDPDANRSGTGSDGLPKGGRGSYLHHNGLCTGVSWPKYPKGAPSNPGQPLSLAAVSRPELLQMAWDWSNWYHHTSVEKGGMWVNVCFVDGHVKFTHNMGEGTPDAQAPYWWNLFNPRQPVNLEKPCSPTCAEEAAQN